MKSVEPKHRPCTVCGTEPGQPCMDDDGKPTPKAFHSARVVGRPGPIVLEREGQGFVVRPTEET
jgi:hypothetical protein